MTNSPDQSSAATGEAAIMAAAREATPANRVYRSEGDLWTDAPINLSKFVRFLARQPYVVGIDGAAQAARKPGEEHPILKQAGELHDLGFNAGWNGAIDEAAKILDHRASIWARDQGQNPRGKCSQSLEEECIDAAAAIRKLAAQPPAAPVEDGSIQEGDMLSYTMKDGLGKITSHVRPPAAPVENSCTGLCKDGSGEGCNCGPAAYQRSSAGSVRDVLLNAIDSPTVAALADVLRPRNTPSIFTKSLSEQVVEILEPRLRDEPQEVRVRGDAQ